MRIQRVLPLQHNCCTLLMPMDVTVDQRGGVSHNAQRLPSWVRCSTAEIVQKQYEQKQADAAWRTC